MAADIARGCNEQLINSQLGKTMFNQNPGLISLSSEIFAGNPTMESNMVDGPKCSGVATAFQKTQHWTASHKVDLQGNWTDGGGSSYTLASDDSRYNSETRGPSATEDTGGHNSSVGVQRSTLGTSGTVENTGLMYVLALLLPLVSAHNFDMQWRCTPSAVLRGTELFLIQLSRFLRQARGYLQQLARDQIARDLFATAMDIVLVVYAIGFLFLSLYQASIFA